jgi:peptidyl-prolyl cis-trans isomerase D
MLQSMRHLAHTPVVKGLMIVLVVSFALWGIGDIFRGNPLERSVAKVGHESITVQALTRQFDQALVDARRRFGPDFTAQQAKQMGILDKTLVTMEQRSQIDQIIKKLGINVSANVVLDEVAQQPQFRDKDGHFNKALFRQLLRQAGLNEQNFVEQGRQDLARHQLIDVFTNVAATPKTIVDNVYNARGQKRVLDVLTLKNDSIANLPAPDEKLLHDFYDKNPQLFTAPEYRSLTIARLSTDDVAKEITFSDEDLKKEYDTHPEQLIQPERRDILQVVLQNEDKAKELEANAKASGNLTAAAKTMGYSTIPLDQTEEKTLLSELVKPVFSLKQGEISDPIHSSLGWHVVQVKKIFPSGKPEFNAIKETMRKEMQRDQAIENMTKDVNQLDDELAAGHSLEDIADSLKMRVIKIPAIDAAGKTPDGKAPAELPNKDDVLKTGFSQNGGDTSPVIDDKNGNYIVIRTDEVTPSAVKPFDSVKDQIIAAWKSAEQAKRAAAEAEKIATDLRSGKSAASYNGQPGIEVRTSKPISLLGDTDAELPPSVLPSVYKLKKGEVTVLPILDKQYVLRLAEILPANTNDSDEAKSKIADELKSTVPNELTEEYLKYLSIIFPVEVNQDALETVRQQGS